MKRYNLILLSSFIITICALVLLTLVDMDFNRQEKSVVFADDDLLGTLTKEDGEIYMGNVELIYGKAPYANSINYLEAVEYAQMLLENGGVDSTEFIKETTYVGYAQGKDTYDIFFDVRDWLTSKEEGVDTRYPAEYGYHIRINMYNKNLIFLMTSINDAQQANVEKYQKEVEEKTLEIEEFCKACMVNLDFGTPKIVEMLQTITPSKEGVIVECQILEADNTHYSMSVEYPAMRLVHLVKKGTPFPKE